MAYLSSLLESKSKFVCLWIFKLERPSWIWECHSPGGEIIFPTAVPDPQYILPIRL